MMGSAVWKVRYPNVAFGVAGAALIVSVATPVGATVCNDRCFDLSCGRRFPNGIAGRRVPTNVRIAVDLRCADLLREDVPRFPTLSTAAGQPVASNWVKISTAIDELGASLTRYVRDGPELPANTEIVASDTWSGNCVLAIRASTCSSSSVSACGAAWDGGCCAQTSGAERELFRFNTTARDDQPPSYVPVVNMACRGYGNPESTTHGVLAMLSDFAGITDVVTIELFARRPSAPFDFAQPIARWTAPACRTARDKRSFFGEALAAPLGWFDTKLPQIPDYTGTWMFAAVAIDEAGNTNIGPEATLTLPVDCTSTYSGVTTTPGFDSTCDAGDEAGAPSTDVERFFTDTVCPDPNSTVPPFAPTAFPVPADMDAGPPHVRSPDAAAPMSFVGSPVERAACACALGRRVNRAADCGVAFFALLGILRRRRQATESCRTTS